MGCGKSSVGAEVARRVGVPFIDLDRRIESVVAKSIPALFAQEGEARFRELERRELSSVLSLEGPVVVAVGGGALLERSARLEVADRAILLHLRVGAEEAQRRTQRDGDTRPLVKGASLAWIERLLETRRASYVEAHDQVETEGRELAAVVADVLEIWERDPVGVLAGEDSYSVEVGRAMAPTRVQVCAEGSSKTLLVTDSTVRAIHGQPLLGALGDTCAEFVLTPGEEHKTPATLAELWDFALSKGADRTTQVVGFGGGVVTDTAGFLAATWMRGVPWLSVSTTLLGMVDASVGGKTAVDLPGAKNCVGAFWQPQRVFCDVEYLATEETRRFGSGMAEAVKTALLGDAVLFDLLEREIRAVSARDPEIVLEIVRRCVATKARIVSRDPREGGLRAALNLGHTIGHALEAYGGYGGLMHGEAVSLGLVAALKLGARLGLTDESLGARATRLLAAVGLPTDLSAQPMEDAAKLLVNDKKRGGDSVRFVLCPEPGRVEFRGLALAELMEHMRTLGR